MPTSICKEKLAMGKTFKVLVLCTGNSARSILGEMLFNHLGQGPHRGAFGRQQARWHGQSGRAGNAGDAWRALRRCTQQILGRICRTGRARVRLHLHRLRQRRTETCPVWPGHPATAHWGIPDPAHVEPIEARRQAFEAAYQSLKKRIDAFLALPLETLGREESALAARRIHEENPQ
jgi:arsenate reductase